MQTTAWWLPFFFAHGDHHPHDIVYLGCNLYRWTFICSWMFIAYSMYNLDVQWSVHCFLDVHGLQSSTNPDPIRIRTWPGTAERDLSTLSFKNG